MSDGGDGNGLDDLADRIDHLVEETVDELDGVDPTADEVDLPDRLGELATEASDLIEETPPLELLVSVGVADKDGETTVPEAIATGSDSDVVELRTVLALSELSRRVGDDGAIAEPVGTLRSVHGIEGEGPSADDSRSVDDAPSADEERADSAGEATANGTDDGVLSSEGDPGDVSVRSALESFLDAVADDATEARDRIEASRESLAETLDGLDGDEARDGGEGGDDSEVDDATGDEEVDNGDAKEDGLFGDEGGLLGDEDESGLLDARGGDDSTDGGGDRGSGHFSTMPASGRPDMNAVARFSTMPKRR